MRRRAHPARDWSAAPDPVLALAEQDLTFYTCSRDNARRNHYVTEVGALVTTSSTVVAAGLHAPAWLTALIAGGAVFFTGMRQLFDPGARWVVASQSRESLRRAVDRYKLLPEAARDEAARSELSPRSSSWERTRSASGPNSDARAARPRRPVSPGARDVSPRPASRHDERDHNVGNGEHREQRSVVGVLGRRAVGRVQQQRRDARAEARE